MIYYRLNLPNHPLDGHLAEYVEGSWDLQTFTMTVRTLTSSRTPSDFHSWFAARHELKVDAFKVDRVYGLEDLFTAKGL